MRLKIIFFLICVFGLQNSFLCGQNLKLKDGTFLEGTITKTTNKGVYFLMNGTSGAVKITWDQIEEKNKNEIRKKHTIIKEAESVKKKIVYEEVDSIAEKPLQENKEEEIDTKKIVARIAKLYYSNLKRLATDLVKGKSVEFMKGIRVTTKQGLKFEGLVVEEDKEKIVLKSKNGIVKEFSKPKSKSTNTSDIESLEEYVFRNKRSTMSLKDRLDSAKKKLHENVLYEISEKIDLSYDVTKHIWDYRISGGSFLKEGRELEFPKFSKFHKIELQAASFVVNPDPLPIDFKLTKIEYYFKNIFNKTSFEESALRKVYKKDWYKKLKSGEKFRYPTNDEWSKFNKTTKRNTLIAMSILTNWTDVIFIKKNCSVCKSKGRNFKYVDNEESLDSKKKRSSSKSKNNKDDQLKEKKKAVVCSRCKGSGKLLTIKYK